MSITTIVATLCDPFRRDFLLRAIESIHQASERPVRILVVVNGQSFDKDLLALLTEREDIEVVQIAEGSLTKAHIAGRRLVDTEFFSFLDDDDEYLPGALDLRLGLIETRNGADVVVTNGFACRAGEDRLMYTRMAGVDAQPLNELFEENWLNSGNHLFRTASVPSRYFEDPHPYMEWTWLAFRMAFEGKKIVGTDVPTFRINDTPGSLSKSVTFISSNISLYRRMLALKPQRKIVSVIGKRLCNAWHDVSVFELSAGNRAKAVSAHIRSLTSHPSGLRFLSYTRRLLG
ncbi:glycosyltransferase [Massilia sp. TWR1-2-2]|uniref:glycosyltransferase n=1 Tax=Massilia sp. TWR1-2-2 TaxID=2804584 RepID=UPI003CFB2E01